MAYREIPSEAVEIQTGLWLHEYTKTIGGREYTFRFLYSSEDYCFYDKTNEIYREDEEGNLVLVPEDEVLPTERIYMQYASVPVSKNLNDFVSVPVDPSYEIVSAGGNHEVA